MEIANSMPESLYLEHEAFAEAERHWLSELSGDPKEAVIRPDLTGVGTDGSFAVHLMAWPERLQRELFRLSQGEDTLLHAVLVSGAAMIHYKYSGEGDFALASPRYAREGEEGLAEPLPIRCRISGDTSVKELLKAVNRSLSQAYRYQYYPVERLIEAGRTSLTFCSGLGVGLANIHGSDSLSEGGETVGTVLMISAVRLGECLEGRIVYDCSRYSEGYIRTLANAFLHVLEQATDDPARSVASIQLLRAPEREAILSDFCHGKSGAGELATFHGLIERQAASSPDNTAIVGPDGMLAYGELNERASRLAVKLRELGVGKGSIVGILLERSVAMAVSMLAVMKSGAAYLPLDPSYPDARLRYLLEDSGAALMIASGELGERLPFGGAKVIIEAEIKVPEGSDLHLASPEPSKLSQEADPDNVAYVIYTSGTTGAPKGIAVAHRGMASMRESILGELGITAHDRILQFSSASFDASVWEMTMAWFTGARLYMPPREVLENYGDFVDYLNDNGITVVLLPPAFASHLDPRNIRTVRLFLTGGSASNPELARRWRHVSYMNAYGPTETTICATIWKADALPNTWQEGGPTGPEYPGRMKSVPIGKPLVGTRTYVLGPDEGMLPVGVMGELYIGGAGVAKGYVGREELTSERFIPNPYVPGERMYRSGDFAKWLPDGNLDYLGRIDHQVKIRGYRVETGELESELLRHPALRQAYAVARPGPGGDDALYAYIAARAATEPKEIKAWLAERLPAYMIPQFIVIVDRLPLTPAGKIDLAALPAALDSANEERTGCDTETERELAGLWSRVLGGGPYGANDHFFDVGGHSLRAALLVSEIHSLFRVSLTLRDLMSGPVLRDMASRIDSLARGDGRSRIAPAGPRSHYPLAPAQQRLYVLSRMDPESVVYNLPAAMQLKGEIDIGRLRAAFSALIDRHETLRTSFGLVDGVPVQYVHASVDLPFEVADAAFDREDNESLQEAVRQFIRPFQPGCAPLIRVRVLCFPEPGYHMLLTDIHHLVSDGISATVLARDLLRLYAGENLPSLPLQYKDYACWQAELLGSGGMKEQERYWLTKFGHRGGDTERLSDYSGRASVADDAGDAVNWTLDTGLTAALKERARAAGATLYMVLLSAYALMLSRYSGQEEVVVGTPVAGRRHVDVHELIGMFINILPMRVKMSEDRAYDDWLGEIRETVLLGLEHQDYPFDELVSKLGAQRGMGRNPLFDASFALQNMDMAMLEADGLVIRPINSGLHPAKFDLTWWAEEGDAALKLTLEYRTSLFRRKTADRMREDLTAILKRIADGSAFALGDVALLCDEKRKAAVWRRDRLERELEMEFEL